MSLTTIDIPNSVTSIGTGAFEGCSGLTSIIIPDSVTCISDGAFLGCECIGSVVFGKGLSSIGNCVFDYYSNLKSITFCGKAPRFDMYSFADIVATVWYPGDDDTWRDTIKRNYGGHITWRSYYGTLPSEL